MRDAGIGKNVESIAAVMRDESYDLQLRFFAARALGQLCDRRAIPDLLAVLDGPDRMVRAGAAEALRYMPDAKLVKPLCAAATTDNESAVRHNAIGSLSRTKTQASTACLIAIIGNEKESEKIRALAAMYIEQQLDVRTGLEGLIAVLNDPNPKVRGKVASILSKVYELEPKTLESLGIVEALSDAASEIQKDSYVLHQFIVRLQEITVCDFMDGIDFEYIFDPDVREHIQSNIRAWRRGEWSDCGSAAQTID
ncbi:MAG: HEAT repeat domain-containing protein [Pseudomonadota bacterium]